MARRKRIPYDPPHARQERRGRPGPPPRPDQVFLTRRMFVAKSAIVAAFTTLAARLGYLQIIQGAKYRAEDEEATFGHERLVPTRGLIYDRRGRELAVNRQTWQVRVAPADLPSAKHAPAERRWVLDQLINALDLPDALVLDKTALPSEERETVFARTAQLLDKILHVEPTDEEGWIEAREENPDGRISDEDTKHPFSVPYRTIRVNGVDLLVHIYPSAYARGLEGYTILDQGKVINKIRLIWTGNPAFIARGNVLAVLDPATPRLLSRVTRALDYFEKIGDATYEDVVEVLRTDALGAWADYIQSQWDLNVLIPLEDNLTVDQAALCRANLHNLPGVRVLNRLEYLIENGVWQESIVVRTGVSREVALKLEANKLRLPGVELDGEAIGRHYPGGETMSHILGYTLEASEEDTNLTDEFDQPITDHFGESLYQAHDWLGKDGIERKMESVLRGTIGRREIRLIPAKGVWEPTGNVIPALAGSNLTLTIDLAFQQAVSEILREAVRYANEDRLAIAQKQGKLPPTKLSGAGAVVALDPRNGEVLAMVSYPHYDNQLFVDGISTRKFNEYISDEANKPLLDRSVRGIYPPGSTLKPFMAAAALKHGTLDVTKSYTCIGAIKLPLEYDESKGNTHPCWQKAGHGALDVFSAIEQSCDVFFYNVGTPKQGIHKETDTLHYFDYDLATEEWRDRHNFDGLGIDAIKIYLKQYFWFGKLTHIDLPAEDPADNLWTVHEARGNTDGWSAGDTINVSIGQGEFLTTPLQLALNTAALANGGLIYRPRLIREITDSTRGTAAPIEPELLHTIDFGPEIFNIVKEGMRRVVHAPMGTAYENFTDKSTKWPLTNPPDQPEIQIAGKTGTAEVGVRNEVTFAYESQHAWFTCFAPMEAPEIAISVILEHAGEGSSYAVPVADRVLRAYFELTERRQRGLVLRAANEPPTSDGSVLAATAAFPPPGAYAFAVATDQD